MELTNEFRVAVPVDEAWAVLTDVERIAPCLPGAQLQEVEGDQYRGIVKVKVGPITAQYKGVATFLEQDVAAHRVVLKAEGRDTRGQGNANATVTATLTPEGDTTVVKVVTDLTITGKVAQFGRGVLADVSGKLMGQFVDNLHRDVLSAGTAAATEGAVRDATVTDATVTDASAADAPATEAAVADAPAADAPTAAATSGTAAAAPSAARSTPAASAPAAPASTASSGSATTTVTTDEPAGTPGHANGSDPPDAGTGAATSTVRRVEHPEPEPVDLVATAGGSVARRLAPLLGALVVSLLLWRLVARRRRR